MPEFTLAMIVKNEAHQMRKPLDELKGHVEEIIIVDTGSTDDTVKIAKEYTDKVYQEEWKDDFALARNQALERSTQPWVLMLDADEYFPKEHLAELKKRIDSYPDNIFGVLLPIHNPIEKGKNTVVHWRLTALKNHPRIRYRGEIHETAGDAIVERGGQMVKSDIPLMHYGYQDPDDVEAKSVKRNYAILLRKVEEEPDNPSFHFYLGKTYLKVMPDYEKARFHLERTVALSNGHESMDLEAKFILGIVLEKLGELPTSLKLWHEVIRGDPQFPDVYYLMGWIYNREGRYSAAVPFFEKALTADPSKAKINICQFMFNARTVLQQLQNACANAGEYAKSVEYRMKEENLA